MEILRYQPEMARDVTAAYNRAVRGVPHCYPVSLRTCAAALAGQPEAPPSPPRREEAVLVAQAHGEVAGFVHAAIGVPRSPEDEEAGLIRFFWYAPGERQAGAALLDAAEAYLGERGMAQVLAFPQKHRYPFYHLKSAYLSDHLGHVAALMGLRGYNRVAGEVYLDWRNFAAAAPPPDAGLRLTVEHPQGHGRRPGVVVRATLDGQAAGICESICVGDYTPARPAQDWFFTTWLGVEPPLQGQGLGRLLLQHALAEARTLGYRHASISTSWTNFRAFTFYSNFGYRVADWTYGLGCTLA